MRVAGPTDAGGTPLDTPYRIVVRGELDARFAYLFDPLRLERVAGTTVLSGRVLDQAQLHGFIQRIEELGLEIVSIEQTSNSTGSGSTVRS